MSKPANAKGTRDFAATEFRKRQFIFNTIKDVYELFGFAPLETPALENIDTLTDKYGEEGDQLLFRVLRSGNFLAKVSDDELHPEAIHTLRSKIVDKGLRYDLTIPFARFIAKHHQEVGLPYKRYQIQPVWRADRPAKGRYREFYQCDGDVVGTYSLMADAEFVIIVDQVFKRLKLPTVTTHLNNRKVLLGIAENHGIAEHFVQMTVAFDKLDKIGLDGVRKELIDRGIPEKSAAELEPYLQFEGNNQETLAFLRAQFTQTETGLKGLDELEEVLSFLPENSLTHSSVKVNTTLARGLNYYTGTIYEVTLDGVDMGSVASGGRYDDLTGMFGLKGVPGVGLSFGAERLYDVMQQLDLFPSDSQNGVDVFFVNMGGEATKQAFALMQQLREKGLSCDMYPDSAKLGKQFKFADKRQAKYTAVLGDDELANNTVTVKNLATGKQETILQNEVHEHVKKQ